MAFYDSSSVCLTAPLVKTYWFNNSVQFKMKHSFFKEVFLLQLQFEAMQLTTTWILYPVECFDRFVFMSLCCR